MAESDKLRVPDPDTPDPPDLYDGRLALAAAITLALGIGFFLNRRPEGDDARHDAAASQKKKAAEPSALEKTHRRVVDEVEGLSPDELADRTWSSDELVAVFRYGPRELAEGACSAVRERLVEDELDRRARSELFGMVDRRARHAPYACLLELHLDETLPEGGSLADELDEIWNQLRSFTLEEALTRSILEAYEALVSPPSSEAFWRWARLCAIDVEAAQNELCRNLVRERVGDEVGDLLVLVERHLQEVDDLNPNYDLPLLLRGLERLAARGQPSDWRVQATMEIPSYDDALRVGASFYLCRFLQSPNTAVVERTAEALSGAAGVSVRAVDRNLVPRWRRACEHAFGQKNDQGEWEADALAVWTGEPDAAPNYRLAHAVEIGQCEPQDPKPIWYCGTDRWNGDAPDDLLEFFVDTRGLEWDDPEATITRSPSSPSSE